MKDSDGLPIIDISKEVIVKKMFKLMLEGYGSRRIATYLNDNYDTKNWTTSSVHSVVTNSFYSGIPNSKHSSLEVPRMVSVESFNKVQEFIKSRKRFANRARKNTNPFASFIKCNCGATMNQLVIKSSNLNLYKCANKCGIKSVNRLFLIEEVRIVMERNAKNSKEEAVRQRMNNSVSILRSELKT